mgnify:CR=1 FL=1
MDLVGTKIILTGDPYQIDHPYLDSSNNGLTTVAERFKQEGIAGHVILTKGERSPLAELATRLGLAPAALEATAVTQPVMLAVGLAVGEGSLVLDNGDTQGFHPPQAESQLPDIVDRSDVYLHLCVQ